MKNLKVIKSQLNRNYISIGNELSFSLDLKIGDELLYFHHLE